MRASQEDKLKRIVNQTIPMEQVLHNALTQYHTLFQRLAKNRQLIDVEDYESQLLALQDVHAHDAAKILNQTVTDIPETLSVVVVVVV